MINEVINETEESAQTETAVTAEAKTENSAAATAQEIPVLSVDKPQTAETATEEETPVSPAESPVSSAEPIIPAEDKPSSNELDFGTILEEFEQEQTTYHTGELVEGKVVGVSERGILVDFGHKSEGVVPIEEFTSPEGEVTVKKGDDIEVVIRKINSGDAPPTLSRIDAVNRKSWDKIEKAFNEEMPIKGLVIEKTKGGLRVDIDGVEAFLPGSQVDSRPIRNLDSFKNQEIEAKVIKFSRKRNNIVISRKALTDEAENAKKTETLNQLEEGYIVEGTVRNLTEYGAFIDIGGIDGLLHVTDMSWGRLQNPSELFKVNDHIQVKVLKLDRHKEKVSLGYKQLIPDPWSTVIEVYPVGAKIKGKVSSLTDYGAFIELEPGVEGLVHVSEMSWSKRSKSPRKLLNNSDEVEIQVLGIDTGERRISLGMKQLQDNPWQTITDRYRVGQTVRGKVRNLTDFGAFIEVEEGVDGLVHISDISHSKKIKHPKDVLKRDQEVEAVITGIDTEGHRMSLSIKDTTPSAWDSFAASHKTGDVVRGKISRFAGFGVFVELGNGLEGLCHISELADERVEKPEDVVSLGQEVDFKILRIEHDDQKIGLSHRAVGKGEEPIVDTKNYSSEAKSGMASLGELMNLRRGSTADEEISEEPRLSKKERKAIKAKERAEQQAQDEVEGNSEQAETAGEENRETAQETETNENAVAEKPDEEVSEISGETEEAKDETAEKNETVEETSAAETTEIASETEETTEAKDETAETTENAIEENSSEIETSTAENAEEKGNEAETSESESEAKDETLEPETSVGETPLLDDIEGEASVAPEDSAPENNVAEEAVTNEPEETKSADNETEANTETDKPEEEAEEKTAKG
ncbi:MAG: 30S ribosomal protein S1 [Pyrinomonadaceae bacterium]